MEPASDTRVDHVATAAPLFSSSVVRIEVPAKEVWDDNGYAHDAYDAYKEEVQVAEEEVEEVEEIEVGDFDWLRDVGLQTNAAKPAAAPAPADKGAAAITAGAVTTATALRAKVAKTVEAAAEETAAGPRCRCISNR